MSDYILRPETDHKKLVIRNWSSELIAWASSIMPMVGSIDRSPPVFRFHWNSSRLGSRLQRPRYRGQTGSGLARKSSGKVSALKSQTAEHEKFSLRNVGVCWSWSGLSNEEADEKHFPRKSPCTIEFIRFGFAVLVKAFNSALYESLNSINYKKLTKNTMFRL